MTHTPRACLDEDGELVFKTAALPRLDLVDVDLSDFVPDPYYQELVSFKLMRRAAEMVRDAGGHFFVVAIRSRLSAVMARWLAEAGIPVVDAPVPTPSCTNLPDDSHANAAGNALIADQIDAYLGSVGRGGAGIARTIDLVGSN